MCAPCFPNRRRNRRAEIERSQRHDGVLGSEPLEILRVPLAKTM
jgi:hypothetical protein